MSDAEIKTWLRNPAGRSRLCAVRREPSRADARVAGERAPPAGAALWERCVQAMSAKDVVIQSKALLLEEGM